MDCGPAKGRQMKLRINGNSMRLRVSPSEMARLLQSGRIDETIHFGPEADAKLTYALEHAPDADKMTLRRIPQEVAIVISTKDAQRWASGEQVGMYGTADAGQLKLVVEKDFACLDGSDAEKQDCFPHPMKGPAC